MRFPDFLHGTGPKFQAKLAPGARPSSVNSYQKQSACPNTACPVCPSLRIHAVAVSLLPDVGRQRGKAHAGVDAAVGPKHRRAQPRQAKAAAVKRLAVLRPWPQPTAALMPPCSPATTFCRRGRRWVRAWSPISMPIQRRPILCATAAVVPEPKEAVGDEVAGVGGDVENLCVEAVRALVSELGPYQISNFFLRLRG